MQFEQHHGSSLCRLAFGHSSNATVNHRPLSVHEKIRRQYSHPVSAPLAITGLERVSLSFHSYTWWVTEVCLWWLIPMVKCP